MLRYVNWRADNPLNTYFTYDNLDMPKNPENPVYQNSPRFIDSGLGGFLLNTGYDYDDYITEWGKFKVPTLRNIDKRERDSVRAYAYY
jgi:cytochrome c peroxidase